MPHPVSSAAPGAGITINSDSAIEAFRRHPNLAILVAQAISTWSLVEYSMMDLFTELAGGSKDKAGAIYLALEIQSAKAAAVSALLNDLAIDRREVFYCINEIKRTRQKDRDKLAHWIWGYSTHIPDALLLCNPKTLIPIMEPFKRFAVSRDNFHSIKDTLEKNTYIYKDVDFNNIISGNVNLSIYLQKFSFAIADPPVDLKCEVYESLLTVPEIADTARRRASRGQTAPKEEPSSSLPEAAR